MNMKQKKRKEKKPVELKKYSFKIAYLGHKYKGFER